MTKSISLGILVLAMAACGTAAAKQGVSDSAGGDSATRATSASTAARISSARLLALGTRINATLESGFTSRTDKAGQTVTAAVRSDVRDARGNVVVPSGSMVTLTIETLDPGNDQIRPEGFPSTPVASAAPQ